MAGGSADPAKDPGKGERPVRLDEVARDYHSHVCSDAKKAERASRKPLKIIRIKPRKLNAADLG